jgi:hypothetical protein
MRSLLSFLLFAILLIGCDAKRAVTADGDVASSRDTVRIANDSLEYEIIIFELGFSAWLANQRSREFFILENLETRNRIFASEYNRRVNDPRYSRDLYPQEINYDPKVRYGMEVNYLLYHYFIYFQERYKQRLP